MNYDYDVVVFAFVSRPLWVIEKEFCKWYSDCYALFVCLKDYKDSKFPRNLLW